MADSSAFGDYLKNPLMFPDEFKTWIGDWFATNVPKIPISQIYGFKVQSVKSASATTSTFSVSGSSFADYGAPRISNLPNGIYVVFFGCRFATAATVNDHGEMSLNIDGTAAGSAHVVEFNTNSEGSIHGGRVSLFDLHLSPAPGTDVHTIIPTFRRSSVNTVIMGQSWLHALKVVTEDA